MPEFHPWITPLNNVETETSLTGWTLEYEDFPCDLDVTAPLLYTLFEQNWQQVGLAHVVEGGVIELEFTKAPKLCILYDGYLTVATEAWHIHLCLEEHLGGPHCKTPLELRKTRKVSRAAFYRRLNPEGSPRTWGIQFWNGDGEKLHSIFLPNPYIGDEEDLLPEGKPNLSKLSLYQELREIYVLGTRPIPFSENPLKRPYLSVCTSSRCYPSRHWQPIVEQLQSAVEQAGLDIEVRTSGCLEVCKLGPVVFYSGDRTWYTRVTQNVAETIVNQHLVQGNVVEEYSYPPLIQ